MDRGCQPQGLRSAIPRRSHEVQDLHRPANVPRHTSSTSPAPYSSNPPELGPRGSRQARPRSIRKAWSRDCKAVSKSVRASITSRLATNLPGRHPADARPLPPPGALARRRQPKRLRERGWRSSAGLWCTLSRPIRRVFVLVDKVVDSSSPDWPHLVSPFCSGESAVDSIDEADSYCSIWTSRSAAGDTRMRGFDDDCVHGFDAGYDRVARA